MSMTQFESVSRGHHEAWYRRTDGTGIPIPHQPIGRLWPERYYDYIRTLAIVEILERLRPTSLLDVGCAEGFIPWLAREWYGAESAGCDFAESAVERTVGLSGVPAVVADAQRLPFRDDTFDIVVCSEVIEHLLVPERAIRELKRVARRAAVITTPATRSTKQLAAFSPDYEASHDTHVQAFDLDSITRLCGPATEIGGCLTPWARYLAFVQRNLARNQRFPLAAMRAVMVLDHWLSRLHPASTMNFVLVVPADGEIVGFLSAFPAARDLSRRLLVSMTDPARLSPMLEPQIDEARFVPLLQCPNCSGSLTRLADSLFCNACNSRYPRRTGGWSFL